MKSAAESADRFSFHLPTASRRRCNTTYRFRDRSEVKERVLPRLVRGYTVSLELTKFIRDMAHLKLDILISLSGLNELPASAAENYFVTKYQKEIFCRVAAANSTPRHHMSSSICYGYGVKDITENWIEKERMIYAVAKEFGTKFYAILQPWLLGKKSFSISDREVLEHWFAEEKRERYTALKKLQAKVQTANLSWLFDFSNVFDEYSQGIYFDGCHLFSAANRFLAEKILNLVDR